MRPLTRNLHKAMLPVLNRPLTEFILDHLKAEGINEIIFALNYRPQDLRNYFGDGQEFGLKIYYVMETTPLGTAGAIKNASKHLDGEPFCVLNGDIFYRINLRLMLEQHLRTQAVASIALTRVKDPRAYGLIKMNEEGRVMEFLEKPSGDLMEEGMINAGIYIISPRALELVPEGAHYMVERGLFPELIRRGDRINGFPSSCYWIDVGTPENYMKVHGDLLTNNELRKQKIVKESIKWDKNSCHIHPEARLTGPVVIGEGCLVSKGVKIVGPASIGQNSQIGEGVYIEGSIIWQGVNIGEGAIIQNSIIASRCGIGRRAVLNGGCILGEGVVVPEGQVLLSGTRIPVS